MLIIILLWALNKLIVDSVDLFCDRKYLILLSRFVYIWLMEINWIGSDTLVKANIKREEEEEENKQHIITRVDLRRQQHVNVFFSLLTSLFVSISLLRAIISGNIVFVFDDRAYVVFFSCSSRSRVNTLTVAVNTTLFRHTLS